MLGRGYKAYVRGAVCSEQRSMAGAAGERAFACERAARAQTARSKTRTRTLFARAIASRARKSPAVHVALKKHTAQQHEEVHGKAHLRVRGGRVK